MNERYDVVVIGGGASGMMAAGTAASRGKRVALLEKNPKLGAKLAITGGGRCNITNAEFDSHEFLSHYGKAKEYLYSPFAQFGVRDTIRFFESRGVPIMVEARKRAFPVSQKAIDVVRTMERFMTDNGVDVYTNTAAQEFEIRDSKVSGVVTSNNIYRADSYILATGGMSHPETGSTGDGFGWLRDLGHIVVNPTPTIVPWLIGDSWVGQLAGVTLADAKITVYCDGTKQFTKRGPLLFTHVGVSGPMILNSSYLVADLLHTGLVTARIDLYPDMDNGVLQQYIIGLFDANKNKTLKTIIRDVMRMGSVSAWGVILQSMGMNVSILETKVHSIRREDRLALCSLAKSLPVHVTGLLGFDRAVVADGGVILSEIDTRIMRSHIISNLAITGDLLHINRPSGGYSLQLCWTTGYVAGENI